MFFTVRNAAKPTLALVVRVIILQLISAGVKCKGVLLQVGREGDSEFVVIVVRCLYTPSCPVAKANRQRSAEKV